ncbi:MAG: response regulator transcription factor [Chitinophagaceae bacterium]
MLPIRILIIEDEKKIADAIRRGLQASSFEAEVAYDGTMGWKMFQRSQYNLVILDINLPGITGYKLCQQIKLVNRSLPVLMLTSMSSLEDKLDGFTAGADDYVIKPFDFRELLLRVRALLKRIHSTVAEGNRLSAADLVMNLHTKEITRNGIPIYVTAKEFQLLEYFLRNKNRVVSRADIALHVWGINFEDKSNIIDVYVTYLRKKIDKNFEHQLIQTHIGLGYVLKEPR